MTKKGPGTRDSRSEPDAEGTSENYRVDRVFAPARPASATQRPSTSAIPRPAATTPPAKPPTSPPPIASGTASLPTASESETELALRRQLSRLQRQLADAQRELANKDDEVAAAVEKRVEIQAAYDVAMEQQRLIQQTLNDAADFRSRMEGVEQRLQDAVAVADELRHQLDRERTERATMAVQFDEEKAAFERARNLWRDETKVIDEQHSTQLAELDHQKRAAVEAVEAAMAATLERQKEAHEAELEALRTAHDRSLAALRGELEPKVAQARNLAAEIERLGSEIQAQAAEHRNLLAERVELHKWEQQQQAEAHASELATQARTHATEVARLKDELTAATEAGKLLERNAELREQLWEQTVSALRESQKKLQQELAEVREKAAQADAERTSLDERLAIMVATNDMLTSEIRDLRDRLGTAEEELRRAALDRERFASYLEEGLAMLGALPPHEMSGPHAAAPPPADGGASPRSSRSTAPPPVSSRTKLPSTPPPVMARATRSTAPLPIAGRAKLPSTPPPVADASGARATTQDEISFADLNDELLATTRAPSEPEPEAREIEADYAGEELERPASSSPEAHMRTTRRFEAVDIDSEAEAEPLPDPTRP